MSAPKSPSAAGAVVATVLGLIMLAALAEVGLRLAMPHWREYYSGWFMDSTAVPGLPRFIVGRAGFDGSFAQNNGDFRHRIRLNELGLRDDEPATAADGRIWIVGDSMAFGWGVERNETYTQVLSELIGQPTYNVASPGTDVCGYQGLYRRMPAGVAPKAVVLGLILENDLRLYDCQGEARRQSGEVGEEDLRKLEDVKKALTRSSALYNFFAVSLKRVAVVNQALVALGLVEKEHQIQVHVDAAAVDPMVASTADAVAQFRAGLPEGLPFVVLVAPTRFEIRDGAPVYVGMREKMVAALGHRGIDVVDPIEAFRAAGFAPTHFAHDGHWSPLGHRLAGKALADWFTAGGRAAAGPQK